MINEEQVRYTYTGNGVTTQWPFSFTYTSVDDVSFYLSVNGAATQKIDPANFTVVESGGGGGYIQYPKVGSGLDPITSNDDCAVIRETPLKNGFEFKNQSRVSPEYLEQSDDDKTRQIQDLAEKVGRSLQVDVTSSETPQDFIDDLLQARDDAEAAAALTAADVITTGNNVTACGLSETNAAGSAAAAAASAAEGMWNDVDSLVFGDSPYVPDGIEEGTLFRCDCTGGDIVINLSTLAAYAEDMKFGFVKIDASANKITVNRGGTDTINGTTSLDITKQWQPHALIGDLESGSWIDTVQATAATAADVSADNTGNTILTATTVQGQLDQVEDLISLNSGINDFRLTLTSGVPVTTADVTAATTVYCTPYKGNRIALWNGTAWVVKASAEMSIALGTLTNNLTYDVFCYLNSGVPTLELLAWTNNTTRATAVTRQDGAFCKSGDKTRRLLGSFTTISTTQTCDISGLSGTEAKRYLQNVDNLIERPIALLCTGNHNYTTNTTRQFAGSTSSKVNILSCVGEENIKLYSQVQSYNTTANCSRMAAIGKNTTTDYTGSLYNGVNPNVAGTVISTSEISDTPSYGVNYYSLNQASEATGTTTWYGVVAVSAANKGQSGIMGTYMG